MRLPGESELTPFAPEFPPGGHWLVLAPHADDETFGLGATLSLAVARGVVVTVVVVTDGAEQGHRAERESEATEAARILGLGGPTFLRFPDRGLGDALASLSREIRVLLDHEDPDHLFVTSPVELHPDHRALALAAHREIRRRTRWGLRTSRPEWVSAYEVATPLRPTMLVAADAAWDAKRGAASRYRSQLARHPYLDVMEALGTLRSLTLDGVRRGEAFHTLMATRLGRLRARDWAAGMGSPAGVTSSQ
jgi:LmbE family N-acetylglucosaminyl deacetylase